MKRGKFSLSHYKLLSGNQGKLIPCGLMEVLPGDTIQHATSALLRVSPLVAPVMHPCHVRVHHWFVPHRLVWEDWEKFITGGPDGMDASVFPTITFATGPAAGTLANYLGIPAKDTGFNTDGIEVSALPFRAYALIFNEWYRDQDLITALTVDKTSGADTTTNTTLQDFCWEKDYFTTARPWTQKGPEVTIPLGGTIPVTRVDAAPDGWIAYRAGGNTLEGAGSINTDASGDVVSSNAPELTFDPNGSLEGDLSSATVVGINDLREAFALQRYEEARARYGSRYSEYLRYLGVKSSDARLQRPEYLGGGKNTIQFSEVLQTGGTDAGAPTGVGNMRGHGIAAMRSNRYRRFFEEHGYVITMISVQPRTMYMQALPRTWNRRTKEDFFQKELQHIGQQAVLNKEIYAASATPTAAFGYQDRYDEYRRMESLVAGEFATTLKYWHMARDFAGSPPTLNSSFVKSNPTTRVYAATTADQLYIMANHSVQARRLVAPSGNSFIK